MPAFRQMGGALWLLVCVGPGVLRAQAPTDSTKPAPPPPRPWYQRLSLRGYTQFRYNGLFQTNPELVCIQCDANLGGVPQFSIRRGRITAEGGFHDQVQIKVEFDLVQSVAAGFNFLQMRDLYGDVFLNKKKTWQLRLGLSKVLYGWENLQSSSIRQPFDRSDAINSGAPGERDVGLFGMWAPEAVRKLHKMLVDSGYKGSGDFGMLGVGVYNGQSVNRPDLNSNKHVAARASYPFLLPKSQILELGVQGFKGKYVPFLRTPGVGGPNEFDDQRVALSFILYPRPFGLASEWTWGEGPSYDPATNSITTRDLQGGYVLASYRIAMGKHLLFPFARYQHYDGGKKQELDARYYLVDEVEFGAEWAPFKGLELTAVYMISDRTFEDGLRPDNRQKGETVRLQAQVMY